MDASFSLTLADIEGAARAIAGAVEITPARYSRTLSAIAGAEIFLKFENLQFTASFKERGALNKLLSLDADQRRRGVIAMSAGNHAQGVAYHAGRLGVPATIVMPEGTPFTKAKGLPRVRAHWVRPEIVVHVAFIEWTVHVKLRHSRLLGVRADRDARSVMKES